MDTGEFYSDTSSELWKKVLGEDLHYHVGWGENDIMFNSIEYLYQFIQPNTKILDCGCGWGGPAKVICRDLNCDITSITNSKLQYDYIRNNLDLDVIYADLHNYFPKSFYDAILFIESFCHLTNPRQILANIANSTNTIILREYYLKSEHDYCKKYLSKWLMKIYTRNNIIDMFSEYNFNLIHFEDHYDYSLEPTLNYWLSNLSKVSSDEKTKHLQTLELSSRYLKKNIKDVLMGVGLSTFVFKKND